LWISPCSSDNPTILICNPNAGFYELAYYQNEWLETYINENFNVMLWNYRGYGLSKGSPCPENLKKDGEAIVNYLKSVKNVKKLGVQGESLGGMVATYLGANSKIDFLFVDRSFSSLEEVAFHNFGKWGWVAYKIFGRWKLDCSLDYLKTDCYKVLSSDPNDSMIKDLASLKSGVALKVCNSNLPAQYKKLMLDAIQFLLTQIVNQSDDEEAKSMMGDLTGSRYELIPREISHEEGISVILYQIFNLLESLDAGGQPLSCVGTGKSASMQLEVWLMVFECWGSFYPLDTNELEPKYSTPSKLKEFLNQIQRIYLEHQHATNPSLVKVLTSLKTLEKVLKKLLKNFETRKDSISSDVTLSMRSSEEPMSPGYLIPLACGHSGLYNMQEKMLVLKHLEKAGFICF